MRSGVLLDTGPFVAYLRPRDNYHNWALDQFRTLDPPFVTCEPALTGACFLVARVGRPPAQVLDMLQRGVVRIGLELQEELAAIQVLMRRYASVPMSLADACLVRLAEMTALPILTLDSDFAIYRAHGRRPLNLITPQRHALHEP